MTPSALLVALSLAAGAPSGPWAVQARELLASGRPREALELLKAVSGPPDRERALLLARAYLAEDNDFWAVRSLRAVLDQSGDDCEARQWLALIALRQRSPETAREELAQADCKLAPQIARGLMLKALAEKASGEEAKAARSLQAASRQRAAYPEDVEALGPLRAAADPGYVPPVSARLEVAGLYASNALAGSPTDPLSQDSAASAGGQASLSLRLVAPHRWAARPALEADLKALRYASAPGSDLDTFQLSTRPGLLLDLARGTLLAYRFEALQLAGGDRYSEGPLWYFEAHRGEFELLLPASVVLFGGAGRRLFREDRRTRTEADLGVGGSLQPAPFVHLLGALSARGHWAQSSAYDLWGGSLLVSAEWKVHRLLSIRTGAVGGLDDYPSSAGAFGDKARRDVLLKASLGLWSREYQGARLGLTYELSRRLSTAAAYEFTDHRVLLKVTWAGSLDPFDPRAVEAAGHVALDWGLTGAEQGERVQDLLRQDEALQRGSSCVDR